MKTAEEAIAAGRRAETVADGYLLPDCILEIKPTGKTTGEVVWEWHVWDHLIQDHDKTKSNYGNVSAHPELVDLNFSEATMAPLLNNSDDVNKLRAIGYVGGAPAGPPGAGGPPPRATLDWTHTNGVAYNPDLDQIVLSIHAFSEFWIIDHGTTTAEAASHKGGKRKLGGDLLYRWGNPRAYRSGANTDQRLFAQHNAHWIPKGLPGAGHILVFNNGNRRPDGTYSSVDEIELPLKSDGTYARELTGTYGPDRSLWSYTAQNKLDFYSMLISGAQRLPNGNTLICSGISGTVFEVTPEQEVIWKFVNPVKGSGMPGGPAPAPASPGRLIPGFLQDMLAMSDAQKKELEEFQTQAGAKLDALLTETQRKQFREPAGFGAPNPMRPGELVSAPLREKLKLTDEQTSQVNELQKEADQKLASLLKAEQTKQLKSMHERFARARPPMFGGPPGMPGGPPVGAPGGFGGPPAPGQLLPGFLQEMLRMTAEQKKDLDDFRKHAAITLDALLSDEQKKQLKEPAGSGPGGPPRPGELMVASVRQKLKLTDEQTAKVDELQKEADQKLAKVLTEEQAKQLKEMAERFARGGPPGFGGPPGGFPGGPGGGGPRGPGGPGGIPGLGPAAFGSSLFRSFRYSANYPGLDGKDLTPGESLEALASLKTDNDKPEAQKPVEQKAAKAE
jgi:Spy/CpxP family protein refolding chaperone